MAQAVEHLPNQCEVQSSNLNTTKKKNRSSFLRPLDFETAMMCNEL
jgi:hypothetical protein